MYDEKRKSIVDLTDLDIADLTGSMGRSGLFSSDDFECDVDEDYNMVFTHYCRDDIHQSSKCVFVVETPEVFKFFLREFEHKKVSDLQRKLRSLLGIYNGCSGLIDW